MYVNMRKMKERKRVEKRKSEELAGRRILNKNMAIGSSLGMVLPISTPPNAIAASTGLFEQKDMAKTGLIMGVCGLVLGYTMLIVLGSSGLIG